MEKKNFSTPIDLRRVRLTDSFWQREQELVRTEVIPYQWEALNDRVEGAAPSYCIHNFKAAARMMQKKHDQGEHFKAPSYTFRGFMSEPEDGRVDPDSFYGLVFQDSDVYKWIEAVGYSLTGHPDPELERIADEAIDTVCAAQAENGYLDTYYILNGMDRIFTNLREHHELYCFGHLIEGAVAYYQATGKDKLLKAACRFADFTVEYFGPGEGQCKGYPGHEIAEMALFKLYDATGEKKYFDLACFFLDQRGQQPFYFDEEERHRAQLEERPYKPDNDPERYAYYQAHRLVREQTEAVGHAVRAGYLYSGMADAARLTGDESMYLACKRLWESIVNSKLYITGGMGGTVHGEAFSYPYDLPNDQAYSETCAAISLVFFARRMLQTGADASYGDVMETALYNTVLAGMSLDGRSFFYVNSLDVQPDACSMDVRLKDVKPVWQKWVGCACCPPNIARTVSSVAAYAYTAGDDTLYTHLYMGSELRTEIGGTVLEFKMSTDMPWEGHVIMDIHLPEGNGVTSADCCLAFRIPGWTSAAEVRVRCCGKDYAVLPDQMGNDFEGGLKVFLMKGYLYLKGTWQDNDSVNLTFSMDVHMKSADPNVREDTGMVAFTRGPFTYCMEEADNGKNLHLCRADIRRIGEHCKGVRTVSSGDFGHETVQLLVPGLRENNNSAISGLYRDYTAPVTEPVTLKFIPYYAWANRGEGEMRVWVRV